MRVLTGDNRYESIVFTEQEKKEGVRMCKVLDARERRGEEIGKEIGETRLHTLMSVLSERGYALEEVLQMTAAEKDRKRLYEEYGIA